MSIPKTMKAAVLYNYNDLRVVERDVPKPGFEEALVKVKACAVCGSDLKILKHGWEGAPPMGEFTPGHEYTGEIVALGDGVSAFKIGDRVAGEPHKGCGHCINCIRGLYTTCLNYGNVAEGHRHYGFTYNGGFAGYVVCHINTLHKFSEKLDYDSASLITTAGTSLYGIERAGWIEPGETVIVVGPGPIGLTAVMLAKICGAGRVIVLGTRESRLKIARSVGADITIDISKEDPLEVVHRLTNGILADLVIEASGVESGVKSAIQLVKKSGRVAMIGMYAGSGSVDIQKITKWNLTITGARGEGYYVLNRIVPFLEDGRLEASKLITHTFPLDQINTAIETFEKRIDGAIKVVVKP